MTPSAPLLKFAPLATHLLEVAVNFINALLNGLNRRDWSAMPRQQKNQAAA